MKISHELPPNYEKLVELFGFDWEKNVSTYENTIFSKYHMPNHLIEHEKTHLEQQNATVGGSDAWWDRYYQDDDFRYAQELAAFRREYRFICKHSPKDQHRFVMIAAAELSGTLYGKIVPTFQALKDIIN